MVIWQQILEFVHFVDGPLTLHENELKNSTNYFDLDIA